MEKTTGANEKIVEKVEESNRLYGIKIYSKARKLVRATYVLIDKDFKRRRWKRKGS